MAGKLDAFAKQHGVKYFLFNFTESGRPAHPVGHVRCARRRCAEALVGGAFAGQPTSPSGLRRNVIVSSRTAFCRPAVCLSPHPSFLHGKSREGGDNE